ncbi:MAG: DUF3502 domain-containing protein [Treponema sp.]|jgi:putative aldouronate transport system substrate-binding protein|nr:DUF3502 domain-containing protein [Treponema sp.]
MILEKEQKWQDQPKRYFIYKDPWKKRMAVNAVITQYTPGFNSGARNPDTALPEFIRALKAAGIDKIIAENQRQINAWAAEKKK